MKFSIFNPFNRIAGLRAFAIGLPIVLLASILGYLTHIHFDGVLDSHMSPEGTIYLFLAEGLIDLICLLMVFCISGIIISGFHFRFVDMLGTITLSRAPMILNPVAALLFPQQRMTDYLNYVYLNTGDPVTLTRMDIIGFIISVLVIMFVIIWVVALLFNAYKICVNKKGVKLVASFIISLIVAEVISKILIAQIIDSPIFK